MGSHAWLLAPILILTNPLTILLFPINEHWSRGIGALDTRWSDGWVGRRWRIDGRVSGRIDRWTGGRVGGRSDRRTDGRVGWRVDRLTNGRLVFTVSEPTNFPAHVIVLGDGLANLAPVLRVAADVVESLAVVLVCVPAP